MSLASLEAGILGPAFLAGLLVLATHVPLGREVLARGIIFIDLAVAQVAALGVIGAHMLGLEAQGVAVQGLAGASALAGALLLHASEQRWPDVQEAIIGSVFVLAAAAGVLLLAYSPHGAEQLKDLLAGQILWVRLEQLAPVALLYAVLLALRYGLGWRSRLAFYVTFALAVTASVQLIGVYLVFASLIIPALAVRRLPETAGNLAGYALGALGYALGLGASALLDLPSGPAIAWTLASSALAGGWLLARLRAGRALATP